MAFTVSSPAFAAGQPFPTQFTCDGDDAPPPLTVSDPPSGTKSFAIVMDDPDAPGGTFTHWLVYDVPADGSTLQPDSGKALRNDFGRDGYGGPCPPRGHGPHRYHVTVYALDVASLDVGGRGRDDLEAAITRHALGLSRMTASYERTR